MNRIMRLRIYILILSLSMTTVSAVALGYEVHVPMPSMHSAYGSSSRHDNHMPTYAMQSTSGSRGSSTLRASSEVAVIGNASGHFSTYVPGVGEDITSSSSSGHLGHLRRVNENDSSEDPYYGNVGSIGDLPITGALVLVLLYCGYIARRESRKRKAVTRQRADILPFRH